MALKVKAWISLEIIDEEKNLYEDVQVPSFELIETPDPDYLAIELKAVLLDFRGQEVDEAITFVQNRMAELVKQGHEYAYPDQTL